ncbi:hypothetical protein [Trichocoleus sp. FACHB-90]|jgi:hypothetical protein|uniref:hypothetical protein n=1 Tax=Trichocoleus sp. FACHB-90 TaxID=2692876 RepID=UPI0032200BF4
MRLKSWESPRKQGRNDKGKGGSARARQLKKQQQMLRKKLKDQGEAENNKKSNRGKVNFPLFFCVTGSCTLARTSVG